MKGKAVPYRPFSPQEWEDWKLYRKECRDTEKEFKKKGLEEKLKRLRQANDWRKFQKALV